MTAPVWNWLEDLRTPETERQNHAFQQMMAASSQPVPWAYEVWDELLRLLQQGDNRQRAIAAQVLCNLAASDPEKRILRDFQALLQVTSDERFVTARHCLQALWKLGLAGEEQMACLLRGLQQRFAECGTEKNGTLIRYDIQVGLRKLYDASKVEVVREKAISWIDEETDPKYRKKYASVWRSGKA